LVEDVTCDRSQKSIEKEINMKTLPDALAAAAAVQEPCVIEPFWPEVDLPC
jgi:hypothetical protein